MLSRKRKVQYSADINSRARVILETIKAVYGPRWQRTMGDDVQEALVEQQLYAEFWRMSQHASSLCDVMHRLMQIRGAVTQLIEEGVQP